MSWYPADDNRMGNYRATNTRPLVSPYLDDSQPSEPRRAMPRPRYSPTPTSSTLGRMPLTPSYPLPMEAEVVIRADFLHVMLRAALGANMLSPITTPSYILDVCCGSGRWVREVAAELPGSRVVGLDMTLPQDVNPSISGSYPTPGHPARSYAFIQHNVMEPLTFATASFNLTHMRQMMTILPIAAWPRVVGEMVRVTARGGWVELVEGDLVRNGGPALDTMQRWALQAMLPHGIDPRISSQLGDLLRTLSIADVRTHTVELPIGPHGGRFGELMGTDFMARIEGLRAHIIAARLATPDEFARAQAALRQEMNRAEYIQPFYVAFGRR